MPKPELSLPQQVGNIVCDGAHNTESSTRQSSGKGWGFADNTSVPPFGTDNSRSLTTAAVEVESATIMAITGKRVAQFKFPARGAIDAID